MVDASLVLDAIVAVSIAAGAQHVPLVTRDEEWIRWDMKDALSDSNSAG